MIEQFLKYINVFKSTPPKCAHPSGDFSSRRHTESQIFVTAAMAGHFALDLSDDFAVLHPVIRAWCQELQQALLQQQTQLRDSQWYDRAEEEWIQRQLWFFRTSAQMKKRLIESKEEPRPKKMPRKAASMQQQQQQQQQQCQHAQWESYFGGCGCLQCQHAHLEAAAVFLCQPP